MRFPPLVERLRTMPAAELVPFLDALDRASLHTLAQFLPVDCRCPLRVADCDCARGQCECPQVPERCEHIRAADERDWPLPAVAVAYLLWRSNFKEYVEPPPPKRASRNTNQRAQVAVFAARRKRGVALWHPEDWCRTSHELDDRLARAPVRLRNGADAVGPLRLDGVIEE